MRAISITRALAIYARQHRCEFTINGVAEPAVLLFSPEVLLPVLALHADVNARAMLNCKLGVEFIQDDRALLGVSANVDPLTGDEISVLRVAFFTRAMHQIFGLAENVTQIECAPVFEAYQDGLMSYIEQTGELKWPLATVLHR